MTAHDTAAQHLVGLYDKRRVLTHHVAHHPAPTEYDYAALLACARALDAACREFRDEHYPTADEVFVGLFAVVVRTGTGTHTVLDLFDEYRGEDTRHAPVPDRPRHP